MLDAIKKLARNTLFRLTLLAAGLFVISSIVSLGYIYFATISAELRRVDAALLTEITELETLYQEKGPKALDREVILRLATGEGLYVFQHQNTFSGNLANLPVRPTEARRSVFSLNRESTYVKRQIVYSQSGEGEDLQDRRARTLAGPLTYKGDLTGSILVGRDVESTMRNAAQIKNAILTSAGLALIMGLLSGWYVSRRFSRRIENLNRLATDIRAGHFNRRAPRNYSEDELDQLAEYLNDMLDHIDRLMKAMRYAGDSIAHDLRSPLTRLRTRLEGAASKMKDGESRNALYDAADDAGELLRTFDSVLRIARLEAGERRELLIKMDPKPLLDDIAELYEPACDESGLNFVAKIAPGASIMADRSLLSQAVSNLVENAIKYTPKGGKIELCLSQTKAGRTEISIRDSGPGIPSVERQRVKERFVRLDKSRTKPGSGLGLALVDAIADLHRAEFMLSDGIASDRGTESVGLTATIRFPRVKQNKLAAAAQ